jgi:O-antigen ligase/tetratricopeptide (TPR) repeat protein
VNLREAIAAEIATPKRWIDPLFTTGVVGLLIYGAFTGGAVRRVQSATLEIGILLLFLLYVARLAIDEWREPVHRKLSYLFLPLAAFLAFAIVQLIPLPSVVTRKASPAAYQVYSVSIPGWPGRAESNSAPQPMAPPRGIRLGHESWRSLSLSPSISRTATLKFVVLGLLLWVIINYPVDPDPRRKDALTSAILIGTITLSFVLSIIAIERAEAFGLLRARGTFANYDHFAGFLTLILPVSIAITLSGNSLGSKRWSPVLRVLAATSAFAMLSALVMSGSRAGWIGASLGSSITLLGSDVFSSDFFRRRPLFKPMVSIGGFIIVVLLIFAFLGTQGSSRIDNRLSETFAENPIQPRLRAWADSIHMIEDFPLTGVGLGVWTEIFPHYERPPWDNYWYWGETHNDFLQLLAETGVISFALFGLFAVLLVRELMVSLPVAATPVRPILVGLSAVVAVALPEELFDFDLQVPANALLFVVLIGLALRLSGRAYAVPPVRGHRKNTPVLLLGGLASITLVLIFVVWQQLQNPALSDPKTPADAQRYIQADPASAQGHISMIELTRRSMPVWQYVQELQTVLWLEPTNPYIRDDYARYLLRSGDRPAGLRELTKSVLFSPDVATHWFLRKPVLLPIDENRAIEAGLKTAIECRYHGAVAALATLYRHEGRLHDAALIYDRAAQQEGDGILKSGYLVDAGIAFRDDRDFSEAERRFRGSIASAPDRLDGYRELMNLLLAKKNLATALNVLNRGVVSGVDPYRINMAFAQAAQSTAADGAAEMAARHALRVRPRDVEATRLIGLLCLEQNKDGEATEMFKQAIELAPKSGLDYFLLAQAQERTYDYFAAERALRRALALDPDNNFLKTRFKQFNDLVSHNLPKDGMN